MDFMQPFVEYGSWYTVEYYRGTECFPLSMVGLLPIEVNETVTPEDKCWKEVMTPFLLLTEGKPQMVTLTKGWGSRMSAPGYLDCTDWSVHDTEKDAILSLLDLYGSVELEDEEEGWEKAAEDRLRELEEAEKERKREVERAVMDILGDEVNENGNPPGWESHG